MARMDNSPGFLSLRISLYRKAPPVAAAGCQVSAVGEAKNERWRERKRGAGGGRKRSEVVTGTVTT
jgi:hypothetical protein